MTLLYDGIYLLAILILWPLVLIRRWQRGPGSTSLTERLGAVPSRPVAAECVWIHGVSLGEINATRTLVTQLQQRRPGLSLVISSTTRTGLDRARQLYPHLIVFRFPVDLSFILRRLMNRTRPTLIVLMELETWPNLIEVARQRGIPVLIANGRITEAGSMRRFRQPMLRWVARRMFRQLTWIGAQDETYAQRFRELGALPQCVEVTGSLKYDSAEVCDQIEGQEELAAALGIDAGAPLWVCGSTGPGEEELLLDAYRALLVAHPDLQLALIPRKPERFDEVARLVAQRGFSCIRRSAGAPETAGPGPAVFLGDTIGELRKFYALARVVFVGRTLVPLGGSDVMEVAGLAKAMVVGPYTENFAEAVGLLAAEGGLVQVSDSGSLPSAIDGLLRDPERAEQMGSAARQAIVRLRGATDQTIGRILQALDGL